MVFKNRKRALHNQYIQIYESNTIYIRCEDKHYYLYKYMVMSNKHLNLIKHLYSDKGLKTL